MFDQLSWEDCFVVLFCLLIFIFLFLGGNNVF